MIIEDTLNISAPLQDVWDLFIDLGRLSQCIPGAEVTQLDETTYDGTLAVKVGPISAKMGGTAALVEQDAPTHMEASLTAKDRITASLLKGTFSADFSEVSADETAVTYKIDVNIRGKLGQIAATVIKSTVKKLSGEFLECARVELETARSGM